MMLISLVRLPARRARAIPSRSVASAPARVVEGGDRGQHDERAEERLGERRLLGDLARPLDQGAGLPLPAGIERRRAQREQRVARPGRAPPGVRRARGRGRPSPSPACSHPAIMAVLRDLAADPDQVRVVLAEVRELRRQPRSSRAIASSRRRSWPSALPSRATIRACARPVAQLARRGVAPPRSGRAPPPAWPRSRPPLPARSCRSARSALGVRRPRSPGRGT